MGKFEIKIRPSWFSNDVIVLRYSTNGIFWKSVKCCEYGILENWYYMKTMTSHFSNAKYLLQKFDTLEKVKKFEASELASLKKLNNSIADRNRKHKEERKSIYKQFG